MSITSSLLSINADNVYTSSGNTAVTWISINNYSDLAAIANVYVVPTSDTLAESKYQVLTRLEIQAGDTYQVYAGGEKLILSNGESIQASANAITRLNVVVSYTEI